MQTGGGKVECRRREDRVRGGVWEWRVPSPLKEGSGEGTVPSPENILILDLKMSTSSAFWSLFFALQLPFVHAKSTAFRLRKLAAVYKQTAKGGKASLLETIRKTIVSYFV